MRIFVSLHGNQVVVQLSSLSTFFHKSFIKSKDKNVCFFPRQSSGLSSCPFCPLFFIKVLSRAKMRIFVSLHGNQVVVQLSSLSTFFIKVLPMEKMRKFVSLYNNQAFCPIVRFVYFFYKSFIKSKDKNVCFFIQQSSNLSNCLVCPLFFIKVLLKNTLNRKTVWFQSAVRSFKISADNRLANIQ